MSNTGNGNGRDIIQISAHHGRCTGELDRTHGLSYTVTHVGGVWNWSAAKLSGETKEANATSKAAAVQAAKEFLGWDNGKAE